MIWWLRRQGWVGLRVDQEWHVTFVAILGTPDWEDEIMVHRHGRWLWLTGWRVAWKVRRQLRAVEKANA